MSKVLVTGGAGFIGQHVSCALHQAGHKVYLMDNDWDTLIKAEWGLGIYADVRDLTQVRSVMERVFPDVVIHNAALTSVRDSMKRPDEYVRTNVIGTLNVAQVAASVGVKKLIFASSGGTVYGSCLSPAIESYALLPYDHYGVTKASCEHHLRILLPRNVIVLRYGNVYGPRQSPFKDCGVVATWMHHMLTSREPVTIRGDGSQVRDFIHVHDVARANLAALEMDDWNWTHTEINIGSGVSTSILELYEMISRIAGFSTPPKFIPLPGGEALSSRLSIALAKGRMGWEPKIALQDGLEQTFKWYEKWIREAGAGPHLAVDDRKSKPSPAAEVGPAKPTVGGEGY